MNPDPVVPPTSGVLFRKIVAWVGWTAFLLASLGEFAFARAERTDVYFERYYQHHSLDRLTTATIIHPAWMALLPFLWLPFVITYQRQASPRIILLLPLIGTILIVLATVAVLILCSGPPIQM